jgi:hypothetical protein
VVKGDVVGAALTSRTAPRALHSWVSNGNISMVSGTAVSMNYIPVSVGVHPPNRTTAQAVRCGVGKRMDNSGGGGV